MSLRLCLLTLHVISRLSAGLDKLLLKSQKIGLILRFLQLPPRQQPFLRFSVMRPSFRCLGECKALTSLQALFVDPSDEAWPVSDQRLMFDLDHRVDTKAWPEMDAASSADLCRLNHGADAFLDGREGACDRSNVLGAGVDGVAGIPRLVGPPNARAFRRIRSGGRNSAPSKLSHGAQVEKVILTSSSIQG